MSIQFSPEAHATLSTPTVEGGWLLKYNPNLDSRDTTHEQPNDPQPTTENAIESRHLEDENDDGDEEEVADNVGNSGEPSSSHINLYLMLNWTGLLLIITSFGAFGLMASMPMIGDSMLDTVDFVGLMGGAVIGGKKKKGGNVGGF